LSNLIGPVAIIVCTIVIGTLSHFQINIQFIGIRQSIIDHNGLNDRNI